MIARGAVLLLLTLAGFSAANGADQTSFRTRILPILTKAGCNTGTCHGAAVGQGGFKLSLLGYDPAQDHLNITHELGGRRMDVESPASSVLLRKATDDLDHEGGRRINPRSDAYRIVLDWIKNGALFGDPGLRVTRIEVEPADSLLPASGQSLQLAVMATLSDGTREDVSALALYTSNDGAVAEVTRQGKVTTRGSGSTSVMVRYSGQVVAAGVAVPFDGPQVEAAGFVSRNFIDEHVIAGLHRLHLPPSPLSDDAEFLRRVYLDLIGCLPEIDEVRAFLSEPPSEAKRDRIIAALLERAEFVDFWTMKFGDWLLIRGQGGASTPTQAYHDWVRGQIAHNRPLDQFVRDLLVSQGDISRTGPPNFFTLTSDPRDLGEYVSRMFLGTQIACARCHAHPADRWTQDDYHAFAACFARVSLQSGSLNLAARGEVEHPRTHQPVAPHPLGVLVTGKTDDDHRDRRAPLADWLVSRENPFFARNIVNRVWQHLLGRGLVEPVDDLRPTNPPANPALLDALALQFAANGFDLRWLVKEIAESRTYQLTSRSLPANRRDTQLCSHARLKPLPAQVFADAIAQVTGVPDQFAEHAARTHAVQLVGSKTSSFTLDVLGRCLRERSCESAGRSGGGLALALHLINGSAINDKLLGGTVREMISQSLPPGEMVQEFYLRALSRYPTTPERTEWERMLAESTNQCDAAADLLWTLLNSREFALNH